jgi:chemotaxis protein histidine kinase CheA
MAVTEEQVKQAEQAADAAQQHADEAQTTADASRDAVRQAREAADNSRTTANAADADAAAKESQAAQRRGEADAAARACQSGGDNVAAAQQNVQRAQANADAIHAQFPNACSPETDAGDAAVEAAQSQLQAANTSRNAACAEAEQKRNAADQAATAAATARSAANTADTAADTANDQAEEKERQARADQAAAQQAVVDAANAQAAFKQVKAEYDAQVAAGTQPVTPGPAQPPPPAQPNHGDAAGHSGQPTPDTQGPGTTGASLFDFNLTALTHSWKLSSGKWEKAPIFLEITNGYKHRFTLGTQYTFVAGARSEEVVGLDTKVTMVGDWRQIAGKRLERNRGIKVESVLGQVDETTYAGEHRNTPVVRQDKNPTSYAGKGPEFQQIATRAINDFKSKAYDKYLNVRVKANVANFHSNDAYIRANVWNQMVTKIKQEMEEHNAKFTDLEEQCKNFKIKSSGFIKFIASAGMKIRSGKLSGTIQSKVKVLASSMAEFKGDIKLGG